MPTIHELTRQYLPNLTEQQYSGLEIIAEQLIQVNQQMNLTSLTAPEEIVLLHFYDSLSLLGTGLFQGAKHVIDVGCGGGFPSLPLALCSDCVVTSNDATEKKLNFVSQTASLAGIGNLETLCGRAEELGKQPAYREQFDIAVARGVARMNILSEWCLPFVKKDGYFVAMKGNHGREELAEAEHAIATLGGAVEEVRDVQIPVFERNPMLLIIRKKTPTPSEYPRPNGKIQKKPL